jgi:hypothetical protein
MTLKTSTSLLFFVLPPKQFLYTMATTADGDQARLLAKAKETVPPSPLLLPFVFLHLYAYMPFHQVASKAFQMKQAIDKVIKFIYTTTLARKRDVNLHYF